MIQTRLIYECTDGTRFDKFEYASHYESHYNELLNLTDRLLGKRTDDVENARCYLEHPIENVKEYKKGACRIAGELIPQFKKEFTECADGTRHISHAERIVSDYHVKMLDNAFFRLRCIDEHTGREYQQPYFAMHPKEYEEFHEKYYKHESK